MKKTLYLCMLFIFAVSPIQAYVNEHGLTLRFQYAPFGLAGTTVPDQSGAEINSESTYAKYNSSPIDFYTGFEIAGGYYYKYIQSELSYISSKINNRVIASSTGGITDVVTNFSQIDWKFGKRFSNIGDTSYTLIYTGLQKTSLHYEYNNTEAITYGYFIGIRTLQSFGLSTSIEFILSAELKAGTSPYDWNTIKSDLTINADLKTNITVEGHLGFGIQYEPYGIASLVKFSPIGFINEFAKGDDRIGASLYAFRIGFEIQYTLQNYKFNRP